MTEQDRSTSRNSKRRWIKTPVGYLTVAFLAATFSVALYGGVQFLYQKYFAQTRFSQGPLDNPLSADDGGPADKGILIQTSNSFRKIAREVGPAVVNIKSKKTAAQSPHGQGGISPFEGTPFEDFFERFGQQMPQQRQQPQIGLGSGILIDSKGYVVTNNHVIEGASEIMISLDGQTKDYKAKLIGADAKTDLAVLKIEDIDSLPAPASWADSDKAEVGDWAIAIGSPFALGQSVTVGIISAKGGRNSLALTGAEYGGDLLQTDAAINPGNSGGPLCDIEGRVLGVNTAIYTRSGGYMGIGFAIPSNLAKYVVSTLIQDGKITRGWLGVYIQPLSPEMANELKVENGVAIHEAIPGSPAAKAGLKAGDIVTHVDGTVITSVNQLQGMVSRKKPGETVTLTAVSYGDKKSRTVKVTIGKLPETKEAANDSPSNGTPNKAGLLLSPSSRGDGLVVELVQPRSSAQGAGLEVGDIIISVNRKKVSSVSQFDKIAEKNQRLYLQVKRDGRQLFVELLIPR